MVTCLPRAFEDFQAFEVDKTVDILKPLTVN